MPAVEKTNRSSLNDVAPAVEIVRRLQADQPRQQRIETLAVTGVEVDAADLLDRPLQRLQLLEPEQQRILIHQAGGVQERARRRGLLLAADQIRLGDPPRLHHLPHRHSASVLVRYAFASSAKQPRSHSITTRAAGSRLRWFCTRSQTSRRRGSRVARKCRSASSSAETQSGRMPAA